MESRQIATIREPQRAPYQRADFQPWVLGQQRVPRQRVEAQPLPPRVEMRPPEERQPPPPRQVEGERMEKLQMVTKKERPEESRLDFPFCPLPRAGRSPAALGARVCFGGGG